MDERSRDALDTFPKLLIYHAQQRTDHVAMREKNLGIWQTWTWGEVFGEVRALTAGLAAMGLKPRDRVAILGDNRPQLYWALMASQTTGAVPIPIFPDASVDEVQYVLSNAAVRFAVVENQEQVDKLLSIKDRLPTLEAIIYKDPRGLQNFAAPLLHAFSTVQARGRDYLIEHPDFFEEQVSIVCGDDPAVVLFTAGTTRTPRGVVLSYSNLLETAKRATDMDCIGEHEEVVAYLPMAWVGAHVFYYCHGMLKGFCLNFPESSDTVFSDTQEIAPTYFLAPPRLWESFITKVDMRMDACSRVRRKLFTYYMKLAQRLGSRILNRQPVSFGERVQYAIGDRLIYAPLRRQLGLQHVRVAYTGGEAIGNDIFEFFRAIGVNLKQFYCQTESSGFICHQRDCDVNPDTVGPPNQGVELRIDEHGEVLYRSPGTFMEYLNDDAATRSVKTKEGWVRSGEIGVITESGHLRIIDRASDMIRLNDGTEFSPKFVENKLRFNQYIKEAVVFGDGRSSVTAVVNVDFDVISGWAERRNLTFTGYVDLVQRDEVHELIRAHIEAVNKELAVEPHWGANQISRFLILHKELDPDDGEVTRTRKIRRHVISERYAEMIESLYGDDDTTYVEAPVTYEDGSKGILAANLRVTTANIHPSIGKAG
ncbi:MAG: AMP-binding protein [Marinobacter sp.]|uniref:AMP-dependent synthetase/ligase n=1 Tax=Marinobacter sp. TaxID=50741 RepID=UPI00329A1303